MSWIICGIIKLWDGRGGGFRLFMDTPTRRTRRQNSPSSFWPWTTTESPGTYTRVVMSLPLRVRIEVLQLPNRKEIIQVLRTFGNRPYLSALLILTTMWRLRMSTPVSNAGTYLNDQTISLHIPVTSNYYSIWQSRGSVLAFSTQVCGFKPGRSRRIFRVKKSSARLPSEGK